MIVMSVSLVNIQLATLVDTPSCFVEAAVQMFGSRVERLSQHVVPSERQLVPRRGHCCST